MGRHSLSLVHSSLQTAQEHKHNKRPLACSDRRCTTAKSFTVHCIGPAYRFKASSFQIATSTSTLLLLMLFVATANGIVFDDSCCF
ncbi:hypothetical protein E3N88_02657 [Mikania micrantha]|uniref:Uncharacterized protein n=1 Tax=Mikania micrantha TaxID=192012 RepID=A0A5N6Q6E7_9ASTR|nr:hypothetical protein E3N88_02657 [Mikania micrantha]